MRSVVLSFTSSLRRESVWASIGNIVVIALFVGHRKVETNPPHLFPVSSNRVACPPSASRIMSYDQQLTHRNLVAIKLLPSPEVRSVTGWKLGVYAKRGTNLSMCGRMSL